jgi:hypothetical protein
MEDAFYIIYGLFLFVGFIIYSALPSGASDARRNFAEAWILIGIVLFFVIVLLIRLVMWLVGK